MNEIPDINKRIKELVAEFSAGNVQKFVDLIGVSHQVLNRIFSIDTRSNKYPKPSGLILTAIQTKLPQVNTTWLLTGEGEMLKDAKPKEAVIATDSIVIPNDVWDVIKNQAESLKTKDQQTSKVIEMLEEQLKKSQHVQTQFRAANSVVVEDE